MEQEKTMTVYKENIVAHIGGFVVRNILKSPHCALCAEALLGRDNHHELYLRLTKIKDNGGLMIPSDDVFKILKKCESFFVAYISGQRGDERISRVAYAKDILSNKIRQELLGSNIFNSLSAHDLENAFETQDLHSTQLIKKVISEYLKIRFFRYGQHYTSVKIKKLKHGLRQQSNRMLVFQGL